MICGNFPKEFIIDGLKLVLENNVMTFNNKCYLQINGTAMGTKMAPTYATLVMGYLEMKLYQKIEEEYNYEIRTYFEENWKRFLDDCFLLWPYGNTRQLIDIVNSLHPKIQFTSEQSDTNCPFLDVMVIKEGRKIKTDLYNKPTDSKRYVHFRSSHPNHTKRNIPYNLARRIAMIVEEKDMRTVRFQELAKNLTKCGYPKSLIKDSIEKYKNCDSKDLRILSAKRKKNLLVFVNDYNPNNPKLIEIIRNSIEMLNSDEKMKKVMSKKTLIHSQRQPKNLKRLLTRSKFENSQIQNVKPKIVEKCNGATCLLCAYMIEGETFTMKNQQVLQVNSYMNCRSTYVIYCLQCQGCGENYIGSTFTFRDRMNLHKSMTRNSDKPSALGANKHFAECASHLDIKFKTFPFHHVFIKSERILRREEEKFIKKYNPTLNRLT